MLSFVTDSHGCNVPLDYSDGAIIAQDGSEKIAYCPHGKDPGDWSHWVLYNPNKNLDDYLNDDYLTKAIANTYNSAFLASTIYQDSIRGIKK